MGTNYYLESNVCPHCERSDEKIHIGKSSGGWCFMLQVLPDLMLNTLDDWEQAWSKPNTRITNDEGCVVTPEKMIEIITNRSWKGQVRTAEFLRQNHAIEGPNNLLRFKVSEENHCIGHGAGTWDYVTGYFS